MCKTIVLEIKYINNKNKKEVTNMRNCTYNKIVHCLFYVVLYVIQIYSINNIEIIKYTTLYNII
ncbi:hypothetical protein C923_01677 [Plasmodium falciparum UGT5.1]|uniref:Uncharacterized protein n=1 Tax=Plasmodium falciparum UGT5.1 TaxID=1237627 RepID=W7JF95_PLAFA|nr:hypothetical protein C923_01678 [Plasmodium falciparum UGT5.1]EWC77655.1 hypothetical protein C923_01677 [Plasmodium falciparum UGT5.1]